MPRRNIALRLTRNVFVRDEMPSRQMGTTRDGSKLIIRAEFISSSATTVANASPSQHPSSAFSLCAFLLASKQEKVPSECTKNGSKFEVKKQRRDPEPNEAREAISLPSCVEYSSVQFQRKSSRFALLVQSTSPERLPNRQHPSRRFIGAPVHALFFSRTHLDTEITPVNVITEEEILGR